MAFRGGVGRLGVYEDTYEKICRGRELEFLNFWRGFEFRGGGGSGRHGNQTRAICLMVSVLLCILLFLCLHTYVALFFVYKINAKSVSSEFDRSSGGYSSLLCV